MPISRMNAAELACAIVAMAWNAAHAVPVTWTRTTGFWEVAGNWNPGVPLAGDTVTISVAGPQTVTFRSPTTVTIASLAVGSGTNQDSLAVTGGALTVTGSYTCAADTAIGGGSLMLNGGSTSNTLTQTSGSLGGTGTVSINGAASFTFGDHRGAGTTILNGPATISASGLRLDGGRVLQNNNTVSWSGGQILFNNTCNGVSGGRKPYGAVGAFNLLSHRAGRRAPSEPGLHSVRRKAIRSARSCAVRPMPKR